MAEPNTISDVIRIIVQELGEQKLLNSQIVLATFSDLAPEMKKERALLNSFLQCGGMEKLLKVKNASRQEQRSCIESLVYKLKDERWVEEKAAYYVCAEVYRGITGKKWLFDTPIKKDTSQQTETAEPPLYLDVHKDISIRESDKNCRKVITLHNGDRMVDISLPANVAHGQVLCFPQKGKQDPKGGKTGNLYVTIHITSSPVRLPLIIGAAVLMILLCIFPMFGNNQNTDTTKQQVDTTKQQVDTTKQQVDTGSQVNSHTHSWKDATYSSPKTCKTCGTTEGISLGTPLVKRNLIADSQSAKGTDIDTGTLKSISGVRYENAISFWVNDGGSYVNTEYVVYQLSCNFDLMKCVMTLGEKSNSGAAVRFYIYGDGMLLYKSEYIEGSSSETVQIDVSNVNELKIECETDEKFHCYGIFQATLHVE